MEMRPTDAIGWLEAEFNRRRQKNPRYSLRTFAERLDIPSGRLSELFSRRRRLTKALGDRVATKLALSPDERKLFCDLIANSKSKAVEETSKAAPAATVTALQADQFSMIADWYHFAILSLLETDDFQDDVKWIARRLGISTVEARAAITRLERLGVIERTDGKLALTQGQLTTTHDIESAALQRSHRQSLEQAIECIDATPIDLRDITSITMAIDVRRIKDAKPIIAKFRRDLSRFLETGSKKQEVYNLNIQLVPVTKLNSSGEKL